jgi:hypothetical protein
LSPRAEFNHVSALGWWRVQSISRRSPWELAESPRNGQVCFPALVG